MSSPDQHAKDHGQDNLDVLLALPSLLSMHNVPWLAMPNQVDLVSWSDDVPVALARTAFAVLLVGSDHVLMASNRRRGVEYPGGHLEEGETPVQAAMRECGEEVGVVPTHLRPFLLQRMTSQGTVPDDWKYPHPLGFQRFYVGRLDASAQASAFPYVENDECRAPVLLSITRVLSDDRTLSLTQKVILHTALMAAQKR